MIYIAMLVIVGLVIVSHFAFMLMEVVFWMHPKVRTIFTMTGQKAADSKVLAGNVGIYNGCFAAGLVLGLIINSFILLAFLLTSIFVVGFYGGLTAKRSILYIQALPAALALLFVFLYF